MSQRINGTPAVKIYDEAEVDVAPEALDDKTTMITILEVQGVRCSAKSFQIELVLKQIMVIKPLEIFEKCIIKERSKQGSSNNNLESSSLKVQMTNSLAAEEPNIQISVNENTSLNKDDVEESVNDVETTPNIQNSEQSESNVDIPMSNVDIPMSNVDIPMSNVTQEPTENKYELEPFEIDLDDTNIKAEDTVYLKDKTEVYYEMYKNARKKAKLAKSLALSSFMEARRIKNMYMLDDLEDSDEDDEIDLENMENEGSDEDE
jgi:hypothetical protein